MLFFLALFATAATAKEPPVPPGVGTVGKVTIALLGPGIDYRLPELKGRLARDGEGDLISWDFTDNDTKPFAEGGIGTDAARALAYRTKLTVVVAKEKPEDPQSFGHMMSFVAKTPARIVVWLTADPKRTDWPIMLKAVRHFRDHLFLIPDIGPTGHKAFKAIRDLPNVHVTDMVEKHSNPTTKSLSQTGFAMGSLAGTIADLLARDTSQPIAQIKAKVEKAVSKIRAEWKVRTQPRQ